MSKYNTVNKRTQGFYKEKGSKFIGIAVPCYNEGEAKEFLELWKNEHNQARHLCYAYRFGLDKDKYRVNDDGEPNNSAGAPILGQIDSYDLTNVLIGVVRYYGGTKLGVGGLINAYRTAAKEAIDNGEVVELELFDWVKLTFDYSDMPHILNFLKKHSLSISNKSFMEDCSLTTKFTLDKSESFRNEMNKFASLIINDLGQY